MSGVKVLDFVARELEGRILTVSSVSAFVAAERAADRLNMTATSREAAELAVLLPKAPLERISEEFGRPTADIVEALRPSNSTVALEAMALCGRSEDDEDRRDAAIAAFAAEAVVASEEDRETLLNILGDLMASVEINEERRAFLAELRTGLRVPRRTAAEVERGGRTRMISISMDVCGSTETKARMKERARGEQEQLARWYEAFHREFMCLEWRLYRALFQTVAGETGWDWKNAFVVKGIGDEIWLLYEIGEDDFSKLGSLFRRLLHAALEVASYPMHWTAVPHDDDNGDAPGEAKFLPLKFYIDIIEDAFEVSVPRRDFVTPRLREILDSEGSWAIEDSIELGNRLHAGSLMADGRRLVTAIRTDYIGWEVDRFFRATKFALPCVVTVGQALFEKVIGVSEDSEKGMGGTHLKKMVVEYPIQQGRAKWFDHCFRYVKKTIKRRHLKGVGEGYVVYHVIREFDLLRLRHNGVDKAIMKETFKVFTQKMERVVRPSCSSKSTTPIRSETHGKEG